MPQVIKTTKTEIVSKNGECAISITVDPIVIEINLNIDSTGTVSMQSGSAVVQEVAKEKVADKTDWIVPEFGNTSSFGNKKIKFGKDVKTE